MKKIIAIFILVISFLWMATDGPLLAKVELPKKEERLDQLIKLQKELERILGILNIMKEGSQKNKAFESKIITKLATWGHDKVLEKRNIDTVVVHSIYDALGTSPYDVDGVMYELAVYDVSPHFVISRTGEVYRMVNENDLAWHAGVSQMPDGRRSVNKFSIGIEIIQTDKEEANDIQYNTLVELIKYLETKYEIKHIIGHQNIAPVGKKTDPWNFNWHKFDSLYFKK